MYFGYFSVPKTSQSDADVNSKAISKETVAYICISLDPWLLGVRYAARCSAPETDPVGEVAPGIAAQTEYVEFGG